MAYCVASDVTALTGITFSSNSSPTATETGGFIDEIAGEIGIMLSGIGVAETTSANIAAVLKKYNSIGAACLVFQRTADNPEEFQRAQNLCDKYDNWMMKASDDAQYQSMLRGESVRVDNYIGNQVTDGFVSESDVTFMDEGFRP